MANRLLTSLHMLPYSWLWLQAWHMALDPAMRKLLGIGEYAAFIWGAAGILLVGFAILLLARRTVAVLSRRMFLLLNVGSLLVSYLIGCRWGFTFGLVLLWLLLLALQAIVRFCYREAV